MNTAVLLPLLATVAPVLFTLTLTGRGVMAPVAVARVSPAFTGAERVSVKVGLVPAWAG